MIVKVRYNYKHFNLPPHATADRITVLDERKTTLPWLGFIDRRIARQIPDAKQVAIGPEVVSNEGTTAELHLVHLPPRFLPW